MSNRTEILKRKSVFIRAIRGKSVLNLLHEISLPALARVASSPGFASGSLQRAVVHVAENDVINLTLHLRIFLGGRNPRPVCTAVAGVHKDAIWSARPHMAANRLNMGEALLRKLVNPATAMVGRIL